ncbi:MAG: hypothetical protein AB7O26_08440 [Planctomycetaceae bacterium]
MRPLFVIWCYPLFVVAVLAGCAAETTKPADKPIEYVGGKNDAAGKGNPASGETASQQPQQLKFEGIEFTVPAGWKQVPIPSEKKGFIDGQLMIPAGGEEVALTLSSIGGGIEANVERWKSQFELEADSKPVVESIDIGGRKGTWVDLSGTFTSAIGGKPGPHPKSRMLGVGIPVEPREFYLKVTGPADAVAKVREPLREFVATARFPR